MIAAPPSNCPLCQYSLKGLPAAHRCPECGLEYDPASILFRPRQPWMPSLGGLVWGFVAWMVAPGMLIVPGIAFGPVIVGLLVADALVLVVLAVLVGFFRRRLGAGRYLAVMPRGVVVRSTGDTAFIPWDELSMLSVRDTYPWIKRRGGFVEVSLAKIFDSKQEMYAFEEAVLARRSAASLSDSPGTVAPALNVDQILAAGAARAAKARGDARPLSTATKVAWSLMSLGTVACILHATAGWGPSGTVAAGAVMFSAGVIVYLIGAWFGDGPRKA